MRAYFDASALVKLVLDEDGTDLVVRALEGSQIVATSRVAFVECEAALARAARERRLPRAAERRASKDLSERLRAFAIVEFDEPLSIAAAAMARAASLRALDAIHLASALSFSTPRDTQFLCFDARLCAAADARGFHVRST